MDFSPSPSLKCFAIALWIVSQLATGGRAWGETAPRASVLMIAVDDLNDYVSILQNHPGVRTPNFDRLAKRSVNFRRAYCAAPLCNPSRVAVATGMAPHQTGIYDLHHLPQKSPPAMAAVSLTEQFRRHGYNTYMTGKYYHAGPANWWPKDRMAAMWTQTKPPFSDHGPILKKGIEVIGSGVFAIGPAPGGLEAMPDVAILKNTKEWLKQKHDKPFFIVHGISKPHLSFVVPQRFFDLHPLDSIVLPEVIEDDYADIPAVVRKEVLAARDLEQFSNVRTSKDGWKQVMQAYLASISFCDWVLGELLDALDASPHAGETIIVLWSDHGYHIGEKEKLHKRDLWNQASRVPLLIGVPGMKEAGRTCDAPVSLLDLFPTLGALCRLDTPVGQELAGRDISPLLKDPERDWPHVVVTSSGIGNAAVSDARYRYIRYFNGSDELYDHRTDPREYRNLSGERHLKELKDKLAASLPKEWASPPGDD